MVKIMENGLGFFIIRIEFFMMFFIIFHGTSFLYEKIINEILITK
jgi:hypothetical protein